MFGIQYICKDGTEWFCTGQRGLQASNDIDDAQEYVSRDNAMRVAKEWNKSYSLVEEFGAGRLFVIELVKLPVQKDEIELKSAKPGFRITFNDLYFNGAKKSNNYYFNLFNTLHQSTVFKTEKEAQKTLNAVIADYKQSWERCGDTYKKYYDEALQYTIVYKE